MPYVHPVCIKCGKEMQFPIAGVMMVIGPFDKVKYLTLLAADYKKCPVCGYEVFNGFAKDYMHPLTKEEFLEIYGKRPYYIVEQQKKVNF